MVKEKSLFSVWNRQKNLGW